MSDQPAHGGRVLLELEHQGPEAVVYRVTLLVQEASFLRRATVALEDGAVQFEPDTDEAPSWLADAARAFLRALWSARRGHPETSWPRRVLRWRSA